MEIKKELELAIRGQQWTKVCDVLDHDGELVQQLLTEHFDLLHEAVERGAPADIITRLISPLNINMQDKLGYTVLAPYGIDEEKMGAGASSTAARG